MRTAARPTGCVSLGGMKKYVNRMLKDVEAAAPNEPSITWPAAAQPGRREGKSRFTMMINDLQIE